MTGRASLTAMPAATRGVLWMSASSFVFALSYVAVRALGDTLSSFEVVMFRNLIAMLFMLPWLIGAGLASLRTNRWRTYLWRSVVTYVGMVSWFYGLTHVPLANATALMFLVPLFTVLFASLFLRERVGVFRWAAIFSGFAGALIIVRPGIAALTLPVLAVLSTAITYGAANTGTRSLAMTENPNAVVFYSFVLITILSLGPAALYWTTPTQGDVPWILALGGLTLLAQFCFTRSMGAAPTSIVMPFFFLQMPFAAVIGYAWYDESPDIWIWIGAAVIFGAGYTVARRESAAERSTGGAS